MTARITLQAKAESAASCAVAAAGMLQSIGGTAGKAQHWRSYYGPAVPYMITVLALIIPRQPQLASKACPSSLSVNYLVDSLLFTRRGDSAF